MANVAKRIRQKPSRSIPCCIFRKTQYAEVFHRKVNVAKRIRLTPSRSIPYCVFAKNFIRRGIEAVITGLTRNQFVDNTTRGFESLPLRQTEKGTLWSALFCLTQSVRIEPCTVRCEGSHTPLEDRQARLSGGKCGYLREIEYPSQKGTLWSALFCLTQSVRIEPCTEGARVRISHEAVRSWLI